MFHYVRICTSMRILPTCMRILCMRARVYTSACTCVNVHTYCSVHMYECQFATYTDTVCQIACVCVYDHRVFKYIYVYVFMYVCMRASTVNVCLSACVCLCICVSVCVRVFVCIYVFACLSVRVRLHALVQQMCTTKSNASTRSSVCLKVTLKIGNNTLRSKSLCVYTTLHSIALL